jgi:Tfp pilus assembly protein PilX
MSTLLLVAALLAAAAIPGAVRTSPLQGFDGRWVLDTARSEFGSTQSVLRAREDQLVPAGERLRVSSWYVRADGDTTRLTYAYRTNGDTSNTVAGQLVRTTGRHAGKALEFTSVMKILLVELRVNEHWSLAAGGDTLVIERIARSPLGDKHQVLYFSHHDRPGSPARNP